jgi:hypothetical protein
MLLKLRYRFLPLLAILSLFVTFFSFSQPAAAVWPNTKGNGYAALNVTATHPNQVVRMRPSTPQHVRSAVQHVVWHINNAAGMNILTIGPDSSSAPGKHEIVVGVTTVTSCGAFASGCYTGQAAYSNGQTVHVHGLVEMTPEAANNGYAISLLLHEMGHALGLGHYEDFYMGEKQIMSHAVSSDVTAYRQGDRNGIRDLVNSYNNPTGNLETSRQYAPGQVRVRGWTFDSNAPNSAMDVHVYADGRYVGTGRTGVTRLDVPQVFPGVHTKTGFEFNVNVSAGARNICVYAINVGFGNTNTLLGCRLTQVGGNPFGSTDGVSMSADGTATIFGWTIDPDTKSGIPVHVYFNGKYSRQVTANLNRSDVGNVFPGYGPLHGYSVSIPKIPAGVHTVCVYGINQGFGNINTLLGCRIVQR